MRGNPDFDRWVDEARGVAVADAVQRFPHQLKRVGAELVGPCPACGGKDRFSVNPRKNIWYCRRSDRGGDAIALVEYLSACDFLGACEELTGRPPPTGEKGRGPDEALIARRRAEAEQREREREREANQFRTREIARAHEIWAAAGPIRDSVAERYLKHRGLCAPPGAKLRSCASLQYWHFLTGAWQVIHRGPALVAAIADASQRFIGCHCTWIDPRIAAGDASGDRPPDRRSGKAAIAHPETGELLPAKKVRGSAKGGHIALGGAYRPLRLIMGEGIETVLAVRAALAGAGEDLDGTSFWASVSLGNIGGKAVESVAHPHLTRTDSKGRVRRLRVPGPVPDYGDKDVLMPPGDCQSIVLLGDGDSDRFTTECVLRRAAARWQRPGLVIRMAWADEGADFNDMWRAET